MLRIKYKLKVITTILHKIKLLQWSAMRLSKFLTLRSLTMSLTLKRQFTPWILQFMRWRTLCKASIWMASKEHWERDLEAQAKYFSLRRAKHLEPETCLQEETHSWVQHSIWTKEWEIETNTGFTIKRFNKMSIDISPLLCWYYLFFIVNLISFINI